MAAWMLDSLVLTFGTIVENALLERDEIGSGAGKTYHNRFTLTQLLDPEFKLPRPVSEHDELQEWGQVSGLIMDEVE